MNNLALDEKELERLFAGKKIKRYSKFKKVFLGLLSFLILYTIVFFSINYSGLKDNIIYWYKTEYKNESYSNLSSQDKLVQSLNSRTVKTISNNSLPQIPDNYLKIIPIGVLAPITWRVPNNPSDVESNLEKGLIQIDTTALPGENSNVFITGHSSDFPWSKGNYKTVFVLLDKLSIGDVIQLKYQNKDFLYQVSEIKNVGSSDVSVLNDSGKPILTLMTCTPVGTTLRRLIVISNQIYPDPKNNVTKKGQSTSNQSLPAPR